jgi:hypothetical protein
MVSQLIVIFILFARCMQIQGRYQAEVQRTALRPLGKGEAESDE